MQQATPKKKRSGGRSTGWEWTPPASLREKYYTAKEAMVALGCSERQLRKLIRAEQLTYHRYNGKFLLILRASVAMYIAERTGDGMPPPQVANPPVKRVTKPTKGRAARP